MIRLAVSTLRFHLGGFLASFLALFLGAVIVIGCGGLLETGIRSAAPPHRLGAAPVVVTGDQRYRHTERELVFPERLRLDAALTDRIGSLPGVAAAVEDRSFPAALGAAGPAGARKPRPAASPDLVPVTGHGWSSARLGPYRLTAGEAPGDQGQIVLGEGLAERTGLRPGAGVVLLSDGSSRTYAISGIAAGPGGAGDVFLSDAEAGRAAGRPGTTDSIGVLIAPGADREEVARQVREAVAARAPASGGSHTGQQAVVLTGDERGRAEDPGVVADAGDLVTLAAAFGGLSATVTVFVVAGTVGLSLQQRQRETALLRTIGATPGQLRRMIVGETLVVAVAATALACLPGPHVGRLLLGAFADAGVVPDALVFRSGAVPLIAGTATALLTALAAALVAAHAATRTRPTEALAEAGLQRRWFSAVRLAAGLLCVAGGIALALGTAASAVPDAAGVATPAAMVWTAAFALLGPVLVRGLTRLAGPTGPVGPVRRSVGRIAGLAGHLAVRNTRARTARTAAAVMPVMLASGLAVALLSIQATQSDGARRAFEAGLRADLVVTSAAGGLPLDMVTTIRRQPGVAAATAQIPGRGFIEPSQPLRPTNGEEAVGPQPTELALQGVTAEGLSRTTAFRAASGDLGALRGSTVALPEKDRAGRRIGDTVPIRLGDGSRVPLRLVATLEGEEGYETALVPASVLLGHTDAGPVPRILVTAAPGTDHTELTATLSALAERHPGLRVGDRTVLEAGQDTSDDTQAWMTYLVLGVVVGYATLALVNTVVLATRERRREFLLQRLIGATRRQIMRMMTVEALLVSLAGLVLGALVAAATLIPLSVSVLGSAVPGGSPWILLTVAAATTVLTVAATLLTTAALLRGRPSDPAQ